MVVAVLAVSALAFTRYLEQQTERTSNLSTFLTSQESISTKSPGTQETEESSQLAPLLASNSSNDILQRILESINGHEVEEQYYDFRRGQLDDISLEEYQLYINLLRDMIGQEVETFSSMSFSERRTTIESIMNHDAKYEDFLNTASFFWLEYTHAGSLERIPIILSIADDGQSYLSREWVRSSLELRNFSKLYFAAIFDENINTVKQLTFSEIEDESIKDEKVRYLMDFYNDYVKNADVSNESIVSLRMDQIQFRIPMQGAFYDTNRSVSYSEKIPGSSSRNLVEEEEEEAEITSPSSSDDEESSDNAIGTETSNNLDASTISSADANPSEETTTSLPNHNSEMNQQYHTITIYRRDNDFIVVDVIPSDSWKVRAKVLDETGNEPFVLENNYTVEEFSSIFGMPKEQYYLHIRNAKEGDTEYYRFVLDDYDLLFSTLDHKNLKLEFIRLKNSNYSLANKYATQQSLLDLYGEYIYIDTISFRYNTLVGCQVQFHLTNNVIEYIDLLSIHYRSSLILEEIESEEAVALIEDLPLETTSTEVEVPTSSEGSTEQTQESPSSEESTTGTSE